MRGIATICDGEKYFPSCFVLIRLLRHLGCTLPVQVWSLRSPPPAEWFAGLGVTFASLDYPGPWEMKARAVMDSPWRDVLFLDTDAYPTRDPAEIFDWPEYREAGAVFWPAVAPLPEATWGMFGMVPRNEPSINGGHFAVNKDRHGPALAKADWLMLQGLFGTVVYGDQECLQIGWRMTGHDYAMPPFPCGMSVHTLIQYDFQGRVFIEHRTADKPRLKPANYPQPQCSDVMVGNPALQTDGLVLGFLDELRDMLA